MLDPEGMPRQEYEGTRLPSADYFCTIHMVCKSNRLVFRPSEVPALPRSSAHSRSITACHDAVHQLFAALNRSVGPELLSLDLTMGQFKAMTAATMYGPQHVGELGRRLGLSEPAASLLVDKLEELGLVTRQRDTDDRRRTLVTATAAAEELAARLRQGHEEHVRRLLGALTDDELDSLAHGFQGLLRVAVQIDAESGEAAGKPGTTGAGTTGAQNG